MSIKIRNWTEIWKQSILNLILNGLRHRPSWEREKDKTQKLAGMLLLQTTNQLGLCRKLLPYSKPQTPHLSEPPPLTLHVKGENESSGPSESSPDTTYRLLRVSPISLFRNMCHPGTTCITKTQKHLRGRWPPGCEVLTVYRPFSQLTLFICETDWISHFLGWL